MSHAKSIRLLLLSPMAATFLTLGAPSPAVAQDLQSAVQAAALRSAIQQRATRFDLGPHGLRVVPSPSLKRPRQSSAATKASIIALGALGGLAVGGIAGAAIDNWITPCGCDDGGLRGFMIGAPVGGVVGGLLAFRLTR